jgi:hypothetical protein
VTGLAIFAALLLGMQTVPAPAAEDEIVVMAERMRKLKLQTKTDRKTGITRCVFRRRSGDAAFDAMMCDAVLGCARTVTTRPAMEECMAPHLRGYAHSLATRREAAGTN